MEVEIKPATSPYEGLIFFHTDHADDDEHPRRKDVVWKNKMKYPFIYLFIHQNIRL